MSFKAEKVKLKCDNCGKDIERYATQLEISTYYYCSRECMHEHRRKMTAEKYTLKCDFCGKKYVTTKSQFRTNRRYHFCSIECRRNGLRRENRLIIDERKSCNG